MSISELLSGQRALVIGGGGIGIGAAITTALAAAGADLAIVDVDSARADQSAARAAEHGHRAFPVVADIRQSADIDQAVLRARDALGGIDILATVVGGLVNFGLPFGPLDTFEDDDWDGVFELNLRYVYRALKGVLKVMVEQGTGGSIISIGSDAGTAGHGSPNMAAYGAAKAALGHLAKSVACEYGRYGIRMNVVSPGTTETAASSALPAETRDAINGRIPLGHRGQPEDIANAVVFFASSLSKHVTGQTLGVDGGASIESPMPNLAGVGKK